MTNVREEPVHQCVHYSRTRCWLNYFVAWFEYLMFSGTLGINSARINKIAPNWKLNVKTLYCHLFKKPEHIWHERIWQLSQIGQNVKAITWRNSDSDVYFEPRPQNWRTRKHCTKNDKSLNNIAKSHNKSFELLSGSFKLSLRVRV